MVFAGQQPLLFCALNRSAARAISQYSLESFDLTRENLMTSLMERVAGERRRLRQVRQSLTAATDKKSGGDATWGPFYLAITEYFEASMERLHEQDIRMGKMLRDKIDMEDPDNLEALEELDRRLTGLQAHHEKLLAARDALQAGEADGLDRFEEVGGAYASYMMNNMGHHAGTANLAGDHFSQEDWEHMTMVSEAAQQREQELHAKVFALLPAGLELPSE